MCFHLLWAVLLLLSILRFAKTNRFWWTPNRFVSALKSTSIVTVCLKVDHRVDRRMFFSSTFALLTAFVSLSITNSLYDESDSVVELNANNFNDNVYHKNHIILVNFYLHWCPHCIYFSTEWKRLAEDIKHWQSVVSLAAVDCASDVNKQLCQSFGITRFPRIRLFGLNTRPGDIGVHMDVSEPNNMKKEIIDYLLRVHQKFSNRLHIFPLEVNSRDELFNSLSIGKDHNDFVFLEKHPSYLTAQVCPPKTNWMLISYSLHYCFKGDPRFFVTPSLRQYIPSSWPKRTS